MNTMDQELINSKEGLEKIAKDKAIKQAEADSLRNSAAEATVYVHENFRGNHLHAYGSIASLFTRPSFNDNISSIIITSGQWRFYLDENFEIPLGPVLGPGRYPSVTQALGGGTNDKISCIELVSE